MKLASLNWLEKVWIIQMVWQLGIYGFLNRRNVCIFILNIWCMENPYKQIGKWATPNLKFNAYSIKLRFAQWTIKYDFCEKYFNFIQKMPTHKCLVII